MDPEKKTTDVALIDAAADIERLSRVLSAERSNLQSMRAQHEVITRSKFALARALYHDAISLFLGRRRAAASLPAWKPVEGESPAAMSASPSPLAASDACFEEHAHQVVSAPSAMFANIEMPRPDDVQSDVVEVSGWAYSEGSEVYRVGVLIDDYVAALAEINLVRSDVAEYKGTQAALRSGFRARFRLSHIKPGVKTLTVRALARDGGAIACQQEFHYAGPAARPDKHANTDVLSDVKAIAFYLPQYHPIPENDEWWGAGFTEWSNVAKAKPAFKGHYQPHLPADLGFYDLRLPETRELQARLARENGIYGFAYHHYWFGGKRLLERPFNEVLKEKAPDFPFCLCWANENWTRRWDGEDAEVLISQKHSPEDDRAFIRDIIPAFQDERYIRIGGKPLLIVYRVGLLPDPAGTVKRWREECRDAGVGEIYAVVVQAFDYMGDPRKLGFDAALEFPPNGFTVPNSTQRFIDVDPSFTHQTYDYSDLVERSLERPAPDYPLFKTVFPSWDNTARRKEGASIFINSSPEAYGEWLGEARSYAATHLPEGERLVFINAWNEWAEGCHLEPDQKYGHLWLEVTKRTMLPQSGQERKEPIVSVVIPAYNHAKFMKHTLESVRRQTLKSFEVILVDDGSTDDTLGEVNAFAREHPDFPITVYAKSNGGAHTALNYGIARARGKYIAPLNSDDYFEHERLEYMVKALEQRGLEFAFSSVTYVDDDNQDVSRKDPYAMALVNYQAKIGSFPSIGFALVDANVTISTGNMVFTKRLFDKVGPFCALRYCHDWDFALSALTETEPLYVPKKLYAYRLHGSNSYLGLKEHGAADGERVLTKFFKAVFDGKERPRYFPDRKNWPAYFDSFIEQRSLARFFPTGVLVEH